MAQNSCCWELYFCGNKNDSVVLHEIDIQDLLEAAHGDKIHFFAHLNSTGRVLVNIFDISRMFPVHCAAHPIKKREGKRYEIPTNE